MPTTVSASRHNAIANSPIAAIHRAIAPPVCTAERRQRAGLVGVAAGAEGQPDDDVGDQQVQEPADRVTGARPYSNASVLGRLVHRAVDPTLPVMRVVGTRLRRAQTVGAWRPGIGR